MSSIMILIFESWCTIEVGQSIVILCIVTWDPVYQDTDIILEILLVCHRYAQKQSNP